jgi:thiamine pyrophosphokinase
MQTNGYGLFNSPMLSKSIAIAYFDTKQHDKKHEKNYSHIKFYNRRNQKKKKIREVPWPLVVTLQFDAGYFHCKKTLNYSSS